VFSSVASVDEIPKIEKPQSLEEYIRWGRDSKTFDVGDGDRRRHRSVSLAARAQIQSAPSWTNLLMLLERTSQQYFIDTSYKMFPSDAAMRPDLDVKTFPSVLEKCFRKNAVSNPSWPEPPREGWTTPENWFTSIHDHVRTQFIAKYLDGVEALVDAFDSYCQSSAIKYEITRHARDYGYYSIHIVMHQELEIPGKGAKTETIDFPFEVQIRTELQEIISKLTHKYYESRRLKTPNEVVDWQWKYNSEEFVPNYLGHILHYVEGMIMEVRSRPERSSRP
jgi:ppGpp synthetase/RelA/SpoT-type nucleotidyltranferase